MKKIFTRIMTAFLTMTLILLNIPVSLLAATSKPETGMHVTVICDKRHFDEVAPNTTEGTVTVSKRFEYDLNNKSMTAYGSMWLTLTQFEVGNDGKATNNSPKDSAQQAQQVDVYEYESSKDDAVKIATFTADDVNLGYMQLPDKDANINGVNKSNKASMPYGCKILLRPPLDGQSRTYFFKITKGNGDTVYSGEVKVKVKKLDKPVLIPPTLGKTDGFSRTLSSSWDQSSVQVYAAKQIEVGSDEDSKLTIPRGSIIVEALRDPSRLNKKKEALRNKLKTLTSEQLAEYEKAIDKRSVDPAWMPEGKIDDLVDMRVDREDIEFYTKDDQPPIVSYDRNYVAEVDAIVASGKNQAKYNYSVNARVQYFGNLGTLNNGAKVLEPALNSTSTDLLIMVSTDQNANFEDAPTKGAVHNNPLWPDLYTASEDNVVIKYDRNTDKFFTQATLSIVALYTGKSEKSSSYESKNVRAFIFTNQSGQQAGYIFDDAPTPDIQAQELPRWSRLLTDLRLTDEFQVGKTSQDLFLYDSAYNDRTMIAARNKLTFVGADSQVDTFGNASGSHIVDAGKPYDGAYYANYYSTAYEPSGRFLPGTFVFTPSGVLGDQIGYRIVYEQYLIDALTREWNIPEDQGLNALNALIAADSDAFKYFTGLDKTPQELNRWLYKQISPSSAMSDDFIIDSVQDLVESATPTTGGTVTYNYGIGSGDVNYLIPQAKGCLSYTIDIQDVQLVADDNEFSKVTTEIDFSSALDKVYDPLTSSYKEDITPETNLDTSQLTFIVAKKAAGASRFEYHPALTSAISGATVSGGKLKIEFSKVDGVSGTYFDNELAEYRVSVMFPVTLKEGLTSEIYRNGSGTQRHTPYIDPSDTSNVFPRYRKIKTTTVVTYKKKTIEESDGNTIEFEAELEENELTLDLMYQDFTDIK